MSASTAAAMWQESNVGVGGQRVIQRYLANEFGTRLVVPMKEIAQLGKPHVPPVCSYHETADLKKIHYWTKPLVLVITKCMSSYLPTQPNKSIHSIDIVYGGEYSQGKFQSMIE